MPSRIYVSVKIFRMLLTYSIYSYVLAYWKILITYDNCISIENCNILLIFALLWFFLNNKGNKYKNNEERCEENYKHLENYKIILKYEGEFKSSLIFNLYFHILLFFFYYKVLFFTRRSFTYSVLFFKYFNKTRHN